MFSFMTNRAIVVRVAERDTKQGVHRPCARANIGDTGKITWPYGTRMF